MVNILIVVGIVVAFFMFIVFPIALFFWFRWKGKKKFPFLLYGRDGRTKKTIFGRVIIDPMNKSNKRFAFDTLDCTLDIMNPTTSFNNVGYREITFNQHGEYVYVKPVRIDDEGHLAVSLQPEEKQIALHRLKENQKRYESALNKQQAYILLAGFLLIFIIVLGVVYSTIVYANAVTDHVEIAKESKVVAEKTAEIAKTNKLVTEQLAAIAAALTGDTNLTRRIS